MPILPMNMAKRTYNKPPITFAQQVEKMVSRGALVSDPHEAVRRLSSISYYRLSGYSFPFRQRDNNGTVQDNFVGGTTWEDILFFYELDQQLRLLVLSAIERIEVAIRTQLTYGISD